MADRETPIESALSRIRRERCQWCAAGLSLCGGNHTDGKTYHYSRQFPDHPPCTAPSAEQLVEDLAGSLLDLTEGLWGLRMSTAGCQQVGGDTPLATITSVVEALQYRNGELAGSLGWLRSQVINVRTPLVYGSRDLFWYSPPVDEEGEPNGGRTLEQMIDAARAQKENTDDKD